MEIYDQFESPPGRRLAYDLAGARVFQNDGSGWTELFGDFASFNGYLTTVGGGTGGAGGVTFWLGFPVALDLTHIFMDASLNGTSLTLETSTDSTDPATGTWVTQPVTFTTNLDVVPSPYRTKWQDFDINGVRALRVTASWGSGGGAVILGPLYLYGSYARHGLVFCAKDGSPLMGDFDFGSVTVGRTATWRGPTLGNLHTELYLKNTNSLTANGVTLEFKPEDQSFLELKDELSLSADGITYTSTLTIPTISPGETIGPLYVRWSPVMRDPLFGLGTFVPQFSPLQTTIDYWS